MLMVIDEVNEIQSLAFLMTLNNITSQESFFSITSQNFKDPEDMGGQLTMPKATFGGPSTFEELDIEADLFWHSAVSSITLRFDGHKSPNILVGKVIYPRLFKEADRQRLKENYGEHSPDYFSQARSFPVGNEEANSVLTRIQISSSRHLDTGYTMKQITGKISFCDPAFGGRDKAVYGHGYFGPAVITNGDGKDEEVEILVFPEPFRVLQLFKNAVWDFGDYDENGRRREGISWLAKLESLGVETKNFDVGGSVSYEEQIAIQCGIFNKEHGIPSRNFGYDFSMRPGIVDAVNRVLGFGAVAYDYNQGPSGAHLQRFKLNSEDCCKNRVTELAFMVSDVFIAKQVRGGINLKGAMEQITRTRYETVNKKYLVEDKKAYKLRWGSSPDMRDVLMGCTGMAFQRGFRQQVIGRNAVGESYWDRKPGRNNAGIPGNGKVFKRI